VSNSIAIGGTPLDTPSVYFGNLGKTLFLLRDLREKSQAEVARRAGIGKSQLSKYENGKELPKLDSLERVLVAPDIGYLEFFQTLALIDRRARTLGQDQGLEELLTPGALGKPRDVEPPSMPGLSEGIAGGFEAVFVLLSRLQRQVWEEDLYPRGKKGVAREEPNAALP
jgi:transcriptional regulator with XRE-family HTH domain